MAPSISGPPLSEVLNRLHYGLGISNERLADMAGVAPSTMSRVRADELDLKAANLQSLSRGLCADGITHLADWLLTGEFVVCRRGDGRVSGCLADETLDTVDSLAKANESFRLKEFDRCRSEAIRIHLAADCIIAEADAREAALTAGATGR